jgi:hypothetical protein
MRTGAALLVGLLLALPSGPAAANDAMRDQAALRSPAPGCLTPPHLLGAAGSANFRRTAGSGRGARAAPPKPPVLWEPPPFRLALHSCVLTDAPAPRRPQLRRT